MRASVALLLSGLAVQQVAATWNRNANYYNTPEYNNNECSDKQKGGYNWDDVKDGDSPGNSYDGNFDFSGGWKCKTSHGKRDHLTKRTFNPKAITNKCGEKQPAKFSCKGKKDGFSATEYQVSVEYDTDVDFHYKMPDGSTCKQRHSCKKEGTTVKNTQCGGAESVEVYLPPGGGKGKGENGSDKKDCEIGFHNIVFDCNPGKTYNPPPKYTPPPPPPPPPKETCGNGYGQKPCDNTTPPPPQETCGNGEGQKPCDSTTPPPPQETCGNGEGQKPCDSTTPPPPESTPTPPPESSTPPPPQESCGNGYGQKPCDSTTPPPETSTPPPETTTPPPETTTPPPETTTPPPGTTTDSPPPPPPASSCGNGYGALPCNGTTTPPPPPPESSTPPPPNTECGTGEGQKPCDSTTPPPSTSTPPPGTTTDSPPPPPPNTECGNGYGQKPCDSTATPPPGTTTPPADSTTPGSPPPGTTTPPAETTPGSPPPPPNTECGNGYGQKPCDSTTAPPPGSTTPGSPPPESSGTPTTPQSESSGTTQTAPETPSSTPTYAPPPPGGYTPPEVLPSCLNTWLQVNTQCKDNTDSACYCKIPDFTDNVLACVAARGTEEEQTKAVQFFLGICAPAIPENPGLVTNCPSQIPINPPAPTNPAPPTGGAPPATTTAPGAPAPPPNYPVTTITAGGSTYTVPQVGFTVEPPTAPGANPTEPVALYPGVTPAPVPAVTTGPGAAPYPTGPSGLTSIIMPTGTGAGGPAPPEFTGAAAPLDIKVKGALFGAALAFFAL